MRLNYLEDSLKCYHNTTLFYLFW
ncbi:hypothetical protein CY0110_16602 [Crocosphaera chwakensis CCY0110]|uniref:Uncharacterized protein n=1 Tax=Crocosphaera chwakensis CCY0110 TaxID=391612 RepID=A3II02_9CHRO|nr:hypothetical protein CY0110_16602 [Crocosphaera chwakensis CCY0110]